ncbi:MAG: hypothetical protein AAGM29_17190, partial [Cyanobacteria bacterium J06588_4]
MSNLIKPISSTLLRRGMGKSLRPHQASDPQPLSRQSPFGTLARMRRSPQGARECARLGFPKGY